MRGYDKRFAEDYSNPNDGHNWSGDRAIMDYVLPAPQKGEWRVVLDTDGARCV